MSISVPMTCANAECREPTVRLIHCSSQKVAIDAVDGAPVFSHFITYRCPRCGHTWAEQRYSSQADIRPTQDQDQEVTMREPETNSRESWGRLRARS
jgi:hypothetical protein